jgi:hypothetical protein
VRVGRELAASELEDLMATGTGVAAFAVLLEAEGEAADVALWVSAYSFNCMIWL